MKELLELLRAAVSEYAYSGKVDPNQGIKWHQLTEALDIKLDKMSRQEPDIPFPDPISELLDEWKLKNYEYNRTR